MAGPPAEEGSGRMAAPGAEAGGGRVAARGVEPRGETEVVGPAIAGVSAAPAVELRGLTRAYGDRVVLRDLSLTLAPGRTLLVLGPNGAGKSTLLRVLATLLRPHA